MTADPPLLPFGRTETSAEEVRSVVDREQAIALARAADVPGPEVRVDAFLERIPALLAWLDDHGRRYPWRETTDPWSVYLAEILLQRTRADAVADIYDDVLDQFPDPAALVAAPEAEIRDAVRSLGFVNHRTRTLSEAGELLVEEHSGTVPLSRAELMRPWRVGEYTARATQLFAHGKPVALVDANFARVIGWVLEYEMPAQPHKSADVYELLEALTPDNPGLARSFSLAILDLGALVCVPDNPVCGSCPLSEGCVYAQQQERTEDC